MRTYVKRLRRSAGRLRRKLSGTLAQRMGGPYAGVRVVEGGSLQAGKAYHDVPDEIGPSFRKGSLARAAHIAQHVDVAGLRGVDIGCSVGGISFGLAGQGALMTGVDYDASSISTAREIAARRQVDIEFLHADLTEEETWRLLCSSNFDFAVWLSQWMWLAKQIGVAEAERRLRQLSEVVPVLVFETAESLDDGDAGTPGVEGAEGVRSMLERCTVYTSVTDLGPAPDGWLGGRTVFLCRR